MTREEIMAMAREAGFRTGHIDLTTGEPIPFIAPASGTSCMWEVLRFAALVAAKEREACEKACEEVARKYEEQHRGCYPDGMVPAELGADDCVEAIRARGTKEGV